MKLKYEGGGCGPGPCPTVYSTEFRTYVVQGFVVGPKTKAELGVKPGQDAVEVWPELLGRNPANSQVRATSRGTYIVIGNTLDRETKAQIDLPIGEDAVEVPAEILAGVPKGHLVRPGRPAVALT